MKMVMMKLVKAWELSSNLDHAINAVDEMDTPYMDIAGDVADAIYHLVGDFTDTFEESVACKILEDNSLTADRKAANLAMEYHIRHGYCKAFAPAI